MPATAVARSAQLTTTTPSVQYSNKEKIPQEWTADIVATRRREARERLAAAMAKDPKSLPPQSFSYHQPSRTPSPSTASSSKPDGPKNKAVAIDPQKNNLQSVATVEHAPENAEIPKQLIKVHFLDAYKTTVRSSTWAQCQDPKRFWNHALAAFIDLTREDLGEALFNVRIAAKVSSAAYLRIMEPVPEDFHRLSALVEESYWKMMRAGGREAFGHDQEELTVEITLI
jgi:hypothetical protein